MTLSPRTLKASALYYKKTINDMRNKYNYSGITMMAALWAGKSKID